jgi:hypothetical protein
MTRFLEYLFQSDTSTFVALIGHSGVIARLLNIIGHREFKPRAGDIFLVLVKADIGKKKQ